jgi:K+-transporting ATPase ATPase C chain
MGIIKQALKLFFVLTIITGVVYPLLITAIGGIVFPRQSNGSLIKIDGRIVGSTLTGQKFTNDKYFWPRPSAVDYNPLPSGGSNQGMTSELLNSAISERKRILMESNPGAVDPPADLLLASGSGLDPDISPEAARFQVGRIARARGLDKSQKMRLIELVEKNVKQPDFGIFGKPRINVVLLNLALDSTFVGK